MRKKTIFIIPGFRQSATSHAYKKLALLLKDEGYSPVPVKIPWKNSTILDNTKYFLRKYKKIKAREKYILGFSYGAMIAFIAGTKVKSNGLILCSLSPYFKEDIDGRTKLATSKLAQSRYDDFLKLKCQDLAKQLKSKQVLMLYGSHEARSLIKRVTSAFHEIPSENKLLVKIKKGDHYIASKRYLHAIFHSTQSFF